mmetsp:Transcript_30746/g.42840  ORF Transcript_30746/g.42840 Transcript_30746/m.42840 type:complete len:97 (-) Transcript_30746:768-1058(-)
MPTITDGPPHSTEREMTSRSNLFEALSFSTASSRPKICNKKNAIKNSPNRNHYRTLCLKSQTYFPPIFSRKMSQDLHLTLDPSRHKIFSAASLARG